MKILLKSPYPCLIKTETQSCDLDPNDTLEIEEENRIFVYPQNRQIPFYLDLKNLKDCEKYSVLKRETDLFIILENVPNFSSKIKETLNFSGRNVEIILSDKSLSFEDTGKIVECYLNNPAQNLKTYKIKNFACAQLDKDLFIFSLKEEKVYHFSGEVEIEGNQISVTKKFYDSNGREKKTIFKLEDEIELISEEFFESNEKKLPRISQIRDLAGYKLLESVKAKDYDSSLSFLSEKLKNQIDVSQIKEFFGNFTSFLPISTTEFITLGKEKHFVQFSFSGNQIDDISIDEL